MSMIPSYSTAEPNTSATDVATDRSTSAPFQYNEKMLATNPARKLASVLAKAASTHLYDVPEGKQATVVSMWIASTDTGAVTVRLHHCRGGESPSTSNALLYDASVAAKTTTVYDQPIYMTEGDRLWISASTADKMCFTIYGVVR